MSDNSAAATLAMTQSVAAFTFFLPKITDVRQTDCRDGASVELIRTGEIAGLAMCLGVGAVCSSLSKSSVPVVVSGFMALVIIALYETMLRKSPVYPSNVTPIERVK